MTASLAAGFNSAASRAGSLIAIAAAGTVMNGTADSMFRSFHAATLVGAVLCALSAMLAIFAIPRESRR